MTYNLLIVDPLTLDAVTAALAQCLHVGVQEVDVADEDTDQDLRNWDALVLCEMVTVLGDVSTSLDIYVHESVQPRPSERELASAFARSAGALVLFPAEEAPPSAYWLATESGLVTRSRLYETDDEEPRYTIDRVEAPIDRLPHVTVARIPEVVRELKIVTPLGDVFAAHLHGMHPEETDTPGTPFWAARSSLIAWEKLVRQMEAAWAPSGWYPADLYVERLAARDKWEQLRNQLPSNVTVLLQEALEPLDALFADLTVDDTDGSFSKEPLPGKDDASAHGWWWNRRPEPLPW
ncbi:MULTISPECIES: hypothetical protein [unclassified Streptomyces]|uniref:hypothetical protein n=1 Tax=unclassified Streptomyces TaxID=2593676 RepID=UPI0004CC8ACF|nr:MULTISPECIES: hypothetical protein [unclassified Streptomyces]KOV90627.1 hypothetical protein ADL02_13755 [Streptomyces sp. NRRL WC-3723]